MRYDYGSTTEEKKGSPDSRQNPPLPTDGTEGQGGSKLIQVGRMDHITIDTMQNGGYLQGKHVMAIGS